MRKTAIVTGSATGVGAATALSLAKAGYNVVINYSKSEGEARAAQAACVEAGADTLLIQGDVADDGACRAIVTAAMERWLRIDVLVNNAGVTTFVGTLNWDAVDAAMFHRIIDVNVMGTFQMIRACVPHLKVVSGTIVNVSSVAGALGIGSSVPYVASKGAINAMTLYFARQLAPSIRVNAVCPGLITTRWFVDGMGRDAYEKIKANYEQTTPLGRACSAEDVASTIMWLVDGAPNVTGEMVLLDSGVHLGGGPRVTVAGKA